MSLFYDIRCDTCCGVGLGLEVRRADALRDLVAHASMLAEISPLAPMLDELIEAAGGHSPAWPIRETCEFFAVHRGHALAVYDEYGRKLDQCPYDVACATCGHMHRCTLKIGHRGPHSPNKIAPAALLHLGNCCPESFARSCFLCTPSNLPVRAPDCRRPINKCDKRADRTIEPDGDVKE